MALRFPGGPVPQPATRNRAERTSRRSSFRRVRFPRFPSLSSGRTKMAPGVSRRPDSVAGCSESRETNVTAFLRSSSFQRVPSFRFSSPSPGCTKNAPEGNSTARLDRRLLGIARNGRHCVSEEFFLPTTRPFRLRRPYARRCPLGFLDSPIPPPATRNRAKRTSWRS